MIRALFLTATLLLFAGECDAGKRRSSKVHLKMQRVQFRREKLASGVTLTRAKGFMYAMRTASNITGIFSPLSWFF